MDTQKRSRIVRKSIKSAGGDLRYKRPLDQRAQRKSISKTSKKFKEL